MWILVFINVMFTLPSGYDEPYIEAWWELETMEDCFEARDQVLVELEAYNGVPPKGTQLVCINNNKSNKHEKKRNSGILEYRF
jgi:hypothetical protein